MSLPSSGEIKASQINTEANRSSSAEAPLSGDSSTPQAGSLVKIYEGSGVNQSAPHSYSEFYGKSFALTAFQMTVGCVGDLTGCCSALGNQSTSTHYHNGSGTYPVVGDTVYKGNGDPYSFNYSGLGIKALAANGLLVFDDDNPVVQSITTCDF